MKNNIGIKLLLFGIALIAFFPYAQAFMEGDQGFFASIIAGFGAFSPLIGLVLCVIGLFIKDNAKKDE